MRRKLFGNHIIIFEIFDYFSKSNKISPSSIAGMDAPLSLHSHPLTPKHSFPLKPKPKPSEKHTIRCCSDKPNNNKKLTGFVDYNKGERQVSVHVTGFTKSDLPKRQRLYVQGDRFQKDWAISQLVFKTLKINRCEDVDGLLNQWVGRFAHKNYPILIRVRNICYIVVLNIF